MLGYALHTNGAAILWKSKRSDTVLDSTSSAEYSALGMCAKEVRTTMRALYEIDFYQMSPAQITVLQCDSTSAIAIAHNDVASARSRHIQVKFHVIRECIHQGYISLQYVQSDANISDVLTKALPYDAFMRHTRALANMPFTQKKLRAMIKVCRVLSMEFMKLYPNASSSTIRCHNA